MRVVYEGGNGVGRITEYVVVRAPLGGSGLAYMLTFSDITGSGDGTEANLIEEIAGSFELPGLGIRN